MTRIHGATVLLSLFLLSCTQNNDGDGVGGGGGPGTLKRGEFHDAAVQGLSYENGGIAGLTGETGGFDYRDGNLIRFTLGDIDVGSAVGAPLLTPLDLVGADSLDTAPPAALNISRLLLSLDRDCRVSNGIRIHPVALQVGQGRSLDFAQPHADFAADPRVSGYLSAVHAAGGFGCQALTPLDDARDHLDDTLDHIEQHGVPNRRPTATASGPAVVTAGDDVQLLGSGTDSDGTVSFEWTQIEGPAAVLENPTAAETRFTAPDVSAVSRVVFEFTVTDDDGATDSVLVSIRVEPAGAPPNRPPAAEDQAFTTAEDTPLQAQLAASDPDGDPLSFEATEQPSRGTLALDTDGAFSYTPEPNFSGGDAFSFRVSDGRDSSGVATTTLTVTPVNDLPVADAGPAQSVQSGDPVTLNGSGEDVEGEVSFAWTQLEGPAVTLQGADQAQAAFDAPEVDSETALVFELTVTDSEGASDSDTTTVTVSPADAENLPPAADAGEDRSVPEQSEVTLDGTASADPDGEIASYQWTQDEDGAPRVELEDADTPAARFFSPAVTEPTELGFTLTITDDDGADGSDGVTITVEPVNSPPAADAGPDQTVDEGSEVQLDGSGSQDSDGQITAFAWEQVDGQDVELDDPASPMPSFTAPQVDSGTETLGFELTVTDNEGASASDRVDIFVRDTSQPGAGSADLLAQEAEAQLRGCDPLDPAHCLYPFPSDHFTVAAAPGTIQHVDRGGTGRRINFNPLAMPRNSVGKPIDPSEWNRNDGYSPGQLITAYLPGLAHNPDGTIPGAPPITDIGRSLDAAGSAVLVIDAETGQPHPVWAEIDLNAGLLLPAEGVENPLNPKRPALLIRPASNFVEGRRYVVVLRQLRDADGELIPASAAFAACRDGVETGLPGIDARCAALSDNVFPLLDQLGIPVNGNETLQLAWDFTVASAENNIARLRHMRDDAFGNVLGQVEDESGAIVELGAAPGFTVDKITLNPDEGIAKRIEGTFTVPSYVVPADPALLDDRSATLETTCRNLPQADFESGCEDFFEVFGFVDGGSLPPNRLNYNPLDAGGFPSAPVLETDDPQAARYGDGLPDQSGTLTTRYTCQIPEQASGGNPARPGIYGHGLLDGHQAVTYDGVPEFSGEHNFLFCGADLFGFATGDIPNVLSTLVDLSNFAVIPDASQQGLLNYLFLARLLHHPDGFAAHPEFQQDGRPVFDRAEVFYDGNSQGGIIGGPVVALSKDVRRGVLGVVGMNYSTLLRRSVDFDNVIDPEEDPPYALPLYLSYTDDLDRNLGFSLIQMLWDRSENNGYAHHITDNAELRGPDNQVLLHPAFADHQVTHWSAQVMARTIGVGLADLYHRFPDEGFKHSFNNKFEFFEQRDPDIAFFWDLPLVGRDAGVAYDDPACQGDCRTTTSALIEFDEGRTAIPPIGNVPPRADDFDPHKYPRNAAKGKCQKSHFLHPQGRIIDTATVGDLAQCPPVAPPASTDPQPEPPEPGLLEACQDPLAADCPLSEIVGAPAGFFEAAAQCSPDESGFNCLFNAGYDHLGGDQLAMLVNVVADACISAGDACSALDEALPDALPGLSRPVARGSLIREPAPAAKQGIARVVDGAIDDWAGDSSMIGGAQYFSAGEHIYSDFLYDNWGADDGDDARRLALLGPVIESQSRVRRIDQLQQAGGDQLGVPRPFGASDHYGDGGQPDGSDLHELRWATSGERLHLLATFSRLSNPGQADLLLLIDRGTGPAGRVPVGDNLPLSTARYDLAIRVRHGEVRAWNIADGSAVAVDGVAVGNAADWINALEAGFDRAALAPDGTLRVAAVTLAGGRPANLAYRYDEPVAGIYNEQNQALALLAGDIDGHAQSIELAALDDGTSETVRPGPGYHERQFHSGDNIAVESGELARLQRYGLYVPEDLAGADPTPISYWLHYRGGKAHSGAAWTPRLITELGVKPGHIVATPHGRGTSSWYTTDAHQDVFEVMADVEALLPVDTRRRYLSGYSMGGYGTFLFGLLYPDLFAAGYSTSGAVTQGAWTGLGPDDPACQSEAQDVPEVGDANLCFIEANDGDADAQLNYRILENARNLPLAIHHGSNDELVPVTGVERMGLRLAELGYRYDLLTFIGYEHFSQAAVDEWAEGARYMHAFASPEHPRTVAYKVVPALTDAVNTVKPDPAGATFDFRPDGAWWVDELVARDFDPEQPRDTSVSGMIVAESRALPGRDIITAPRSGIIHSGADGTATNPGTPVAAAGHSTPFIRHGLDWIEAGALATANEFTATLTGLEHAALDLSRMGLDLATAITGHISSDGESALSLTGLTQPVDVYVDGAQVAQNVTGRTTVSVPADDSRLDIRPAGAPFVPADDPADDPDLGDACSAYGLDGSDPVCGQLEALTAALEASCLEASPASGLCSATGGNLHAAIDACYGNNPAEADAPLCRAADAFVLGAAAICRQAATGSGGALAPEVCALIGGTQVSEREIQAFEGSWAQRALVLQDRLGQSLPLKDDSLVSTHNSYNATDDNTPPTLSGLDANQLYAIPEQLRMGVRGLEIDVHWSVGAGGSPATNFMQPTVCHGLGADQGHFGCTTERPLEDVLWEIRGWLDSNPGAVLVIDIEPHLQDFTGASDPQIAYDTTAAAFMEVLGERIFRPSDHGAACGDAAAASDPASWLNVSREQVLAAGGQLLMYTSTCGLGNAWPSLFHEKDTNSNLAQGQGDHFANIAYPVCEIGGAFDIDEQRDKWTRTWFDSTLVGTATNAAGAPITPGIAHELMRCGLNMPSLDQLHPGDGRLPAMVWSWAPEQPAADAGTQCAYLGDDGRFHAGDCAEVRSYACVNEADPTDWRVAGAGPWQGGADACPAGYRYSVPKSGYFSELLKAAAPGELWLNYSNASGEWLAGDRGRIEAPPPQPLRAGAATQLLRVPVGTPLGGYARPPVGGDYLPGLEAFAEGSPDEFFAELLDFLPTGQSHDGEPLAPLPDELRTITSPYATYSPPSRGYYDSLINKVVALYDGHDCVVLTKSDIIGMLDEVVQATAEYVHRNFDFAAHNLAGCNLREGLVMAATHTHDGPGALANHSARYFWLAMDAYQPELFERLIADFGEAVIAALEDMRPARFAAVLGEEADGQGTPATLNSFRRSRSPNATVEDIAKEHAMRRRLGVLRVDEVDSRGNFLRPLAVVMNYAAHGIVFDVENMFFSGDALAAAERSVEQRFETPVVAMLVQNTGGDVSPRAGSSDPSKLQRMERFGEILAPQVLALWETANDFETAPDLRAVSQRVILSRERLGYEGSEYPYPWGGAQCNSGIGVPFVGPDTGEGNPLCLPAPPPDPIDLADNGVAENGAFVPQDTRVTVARIGATTLLAQPGEPLADQGVRLVEAASDLGFDPDQTFIWGYAQDHVGYILADDRESWELGDTEGTTTFWGWKQGGRLLDATRGLLTALRDGTLPPADEFRVDYFYRDQIYKATPQPPATPSLRPGRIVTQPGDIARFGATEFRFEGGDPVIDLPRVRMEREATPGVWQVARRANGEAIDSYFEMHLEYELTSGAHLWTVSFEAPKDWPTGRYRFAVDGTALQAGEGPYTTASAAFAVTPATTLELSVPDCTAARCEVSFAYAPQPDNYRLIDAAVNGAHRAPVRDGVVEFLNAAGEVVDTQSAPAELRRQGEDLHAVFTSRANGIATARGRDGWGNASGPPAAGSSGRFLVGTGTGDHTPRAPVCVGGGATNCGRRVDPRQPGAVRDPLISRAMAITGENDETLIVITASNIGYFLAYKPEQSGFNGIYDVRLRIAEATGVPSGNIVVIADHSHNAPDTIGIWGGVDAQYMQRTADAVVAAAIEAHESRQPATLRVAAVNQNHARLSDVPDLDSSYREPPGLDLTRGNPINDFRMLVADHADSGERLLTFVNYAPHATVLNGAATDQLSGDWPVWVNEEAQSVFGSGMGIGAIGALGATDWNKHGNNADEKEAEARARLRTLMLAAEAVLQPVAGGEVKVDSTFIREQITQPVLLANYKPGIDRNDPGIPTDGQDLRIDRSVLPPFLTGTVVGTYVSAVRLGDVFLSTFPGEPFGELNHALEAEGRVQGTRAQFLLGGANDFFGYMVKNRETYEQTLTTSALYPVCPDDEIPGNPLADDTCVDHWTLMVSPTIGSHIVCTLQDAADRLGFTTANRDFECPALTALDGLGAPPESGDPLADGSLAARRAAVEQAHTLAAACHDTPASTTLCAALDAGAREAEHHLAADEAAADVPSGPAKAGAAVVDASWHFGSSAGQFAAGGHGVQGGESYDPYMHATRKVGSDTMVSRISTRALVVEGSNGKRVAVIANDLYLPNDLTRRRVVQLLQEEDQKRTAGLSPGEPLGIGEANLAMTVSHSHTSPFYSTPGWGTWIFQDVYDLRFYDYISQRMAEAIIAAADDMRDVEMGGTAIYSNDIRGHTYGPKVSQEHSTPNTPAGQPYDYTSRQLYVLRFDDAATGENYANWVVLGVHPEWVWGEEIINGDVSQGIMRVLDRETGAINILSQSETGTSGPHKDERAHDGSERHEFQESNFAGIEKAARLVADTVHEALGRITTTDPWDEFQFAAPASEFAVDYAYQRFAPPVGRPVPGISNCNADRLYYEANPGVPILGFPDCVHEADAVVEPFEEFTGIPLSETVGTVADQLIGLGVPLPHSYSATSLTAVEEQATVPIQAFKLGDIALTFCPCEQFTDTALNVISRLDRKSDNIHTGWDWDLGYDAPYMNPLTNPANNGDFVHGPDEVGCQVPADPQPDSVVTCPHPSRDNGGVLTTTYAAWRRMKAQIHNDAAGWESLNNAYHYEHEPQEIDEIFGNFTHEEFPERGYGMVVPVGMANDYWGYMPAYREYRGHDHYRKALAGLGPHGADFLATRMGRLAASLNGGRAVTPSALDLAYLAEDGRAEALARGLGETGRAANLAYGVSVPPDGGTPRILAEAHDIGRFDGTVVSWVGGSTWLGMPEVEVQRLENGQWRTVADQAGEIVLQVDFLPATSAGALPGQIPEAGGTAVVTPAPEAYAAWLTGQFEWVWRAGFEALVSPTPTPEADGEPGTTPYVTPTGRYRFVIRGQHHEGSGVTNDYELMSDFEVSPWQGLTAESLSQTPGTIDFEVGPRRIVKEAQNKANSAAEGHAPITGLDIPLGPIDYPDTWSGVGVARSGTIRWLRSERNIHRFASGDELYCHRCSFRDWLDTGEVVAVTVTHASGLSEARPLNTEGRNWRANYSGHAYIAAGDMRDIHGNTNGACIDLVGDACGNIDPPPPPPPPPGTAVPVTGASLLDHCYAATPDPAACDGLADGLQPVVDGCAEGGTVFGEGSGLFGDEEARTFCTAVLTADLDAAISLCDALDPGIDGPCLAVQALADVLATRNPWLARRVLNISHRGGAEEFPENTLFAYAESLEAGSEMIEADIFETVDGELVVIHDATVDRTTNGSGSVSEMTVDQLKALDAAHCFVPGKGSRCGDTGPFPWRGIATGDVPPPPGYSANDFRIPTLEELLARFPDTLINIELKPDTASFGSYEGKLAAALKRHGRYDDVIVASFLDNAAAAFKAQAPLVSTSVPTAQVALSVASGRGPSPGVTLGHEAFQVPVDFNGVQVVNREFVDDAHAQGLAVHVWTIDDCPTMVDLIELGVDGIMTDRPSLLQQVLDGQPPCQGTGRFDEPSDGVTGSAAHTTQNLEAVINGLLDLPSSQNPDPVIGGAQALANGISGDLAQLVLDEDNSLVAMAAAPDVSEEGFIDFLDAGGNAFGNIDDVALALQPQPAQPVRHHGPAGTLEHFVGALHNHSGYSDGAVGSQPHDYYARGKMFGLDFMGGSEHSDNLDLPLTLNTDCLSADLYQCALADDDARIESFRKWNASLRQARAASDGNYTAFRGFEWTSDRYGHINVFFSKNQINAKADGGYAFSMEPFWTWFATRPELGGGSDGLGVFNHPGREDDLHEASPVGDPAYAFNDLEYRAAAGARMVGIEVFGKGSEYDSSGPGGSWLAHALNQGWHLGAVGAEDHHGTEWARADSLPKTVLIARDRSEGALRAAMLERRMYAVAQGRNGIRIDFDAEGAPMGSRLGGPDDSNGDGFITISITLTENRLPFAGSLELLAGSAAEGDYGIVADCSLCASLTYDAPLTPEESWVFLRARGAGGNPVAFSSPVWLHNKGAYPQRGEWVAGDLHLHTSYGHDSYAPYGPAVTDEDDRISADEIYTIGHTVATHSLIAARRGLDYLAITDHNDLRSADDPAYGAYGLIPIPGYENSLDGHAQMLGAHEVYVDGGDAATAAAMIRADGGVFQVNHPANGSTGFPDDADWGQADGSYDGDVVPDTVEVWNIHPAWQPPLPSGHSLDDAMRYWQGWLDRGERVAITGGSDNHFMATVPIQGAGQPTTWVFVTERSERGVLEGLGSGRSFVTHQPPLQAGPSLQLLGDGDGDGRFEARIGDTVESGARFRADVRNAPPGSTLRIVGTSGTELESFRVLMPATQFDFDVDPNRLPDGFSPWVRAELVAEDFAEERAGICNEPLGMETTLCRNRIGILAVTSALFLAEPE